MAVNIYHVSIGVSKWLKHKTVGDSLETQKLFSFRGSMCNTCPFATKDYAKGVHTVQKYNDATGGIEEVKEYIKDGERIHGYSCGICLCPLETKLRTPESMCPLRDPDYIKKWKLAYKKYKEKEENGTINKKERGKLRMIEIFLNQEHGWRTEKEDINLIQEHWEKKTA